MPADPRAGSGPAPEAQGAAAWHSGDAPRRLAQQALRDIPWEVGVAKPDPAVVVDDVRRTFGGLTAVSVDHLEIQRGGITGLIGPNGAGKTTLFNLLTGFDQPNTGTWSFAGTLSGGQRKLLEMARALMSDPKVVMLDEPMAGVNPALTQSLLGHVKDLREEGMTVIFVEHDMDVVRDISDWDIARGDRRPHPDRRHHE